MSPFKKMLLVALTATTCAGSAGAATIVSDTGRRTITIQTIDPIGQSFVANGTDLVSIGLQFVTANPAGAVDSVTVSLLQGAGLGGAMVAGSARTITPVNALNADSAAFTDIDFTGITLVSGNSYTIRVVDNGTGTRNGLVAGPNPDGPAFPTQKYGPDAYAGGQLYFSATGYGGCGNGTAANACDLNFRVVTNDAAPAVPEPASWAMMIAGFGLVGGSMRRRDTLKLLRA